MFPKFELSDQEKENMPLRGRVRVRYLHDLIMNKPAWQRLGDSKTSEFLTMMNERGASDLDIGGIGCLDMIWMRIDGLKAPLTELGKQNRLDEEIFILTFVEAEYLEKLLEQGAVDLSVNPEAGERRFRARGNIYMEQGRMSMNMRLINEHPMSLNSLGFSQIVIDRLDMNKEKFGLSLITGLTGSGKSTTLDAIVDYNNTKNDGEIIIIGNPIEYIHKSKKCLVRHREVGTDVQSFSGGILQSLRQDPDMIVIGEVRSALEIGAAMEITDSGHKTFSTLHTSSATDTMHRLIAEFPSNEQDRVRNRLADTLSIVVSQRLIPGRMRGRVLACEILAVDSSVSAAIRNNNISEIYQMMNEGQNKGMITMEQDLFRLYRKGKITRDTAVNFSNNKIRINQLLQYN
ncbi:MAG: Flp pilus assembly complex ATPase component TadA [Candidatus Cloacimonetes bacterium]|nr:Flp pilus assembly complex ATPase component TadA [Candidatus Cloacimonadota bacterium]